MSTIPVRSRPGRALLAGLAATFLTVAAAPASAVATRADTVFAAELGAIAAAAGLPGISGAYFKLGRDGYGVGASGVRRLGDPTAVETSDRFHIGSNVKTMTSTIVASLVRDGKLNWESTLAEVLPELADEMHPDFRGRTVRQLMSMRAGVESLQTVDELFDLSVTGATAQAQRQSAARLLLSAPPATEADVEAYSNGSYIVAGAIIESALGMSWEAAMQDRVLLPLGLDGVTGWPGDGGVDAPWGHLAGDDGQLILIDPEESLRFPAFVQPAGDLMMTAADLAGFARAQLAGLLGFDTGLNLSSDLFGAMHDTDGLLAMPWLEISEPGSRISLMLGSTDLFLGIMGFDHVLGVGAAILTNTDSEATRVALDSALALGFARAAAVPEPGTLMMLFAGFGLVGFAVRARRPAAGLTLA